MALRLIAKQIQNLSEELSQPGFSVVPSDDALLWKASIVGPDDTPYMGGNFDLGIRFSMDYPLRTPEVWFRTRIFHPNVAFRGTLCTDFLHKEWKPYFTVSYVLLAICSLLRDPDAENPIVPKIGDLYLNDREKFDKLARRWTFEYAK